MTLTRVTGSVKSKEGKLVRVSVYYAPNGVDSVMITGDFFMEPPEALYDLMRFLKGSTVEEIPDKVKKFLAERKPMMVGVSDEDFVTAFQKAITSGEKEEIARLFSFFSLLFSFFERGSFRGPSAQAPGLREARGFFLELLLQVCQKPGPFRPVEHPVIHGQR